MNTVADRMRRHSLAAYFLLAFAISWLLWAPVVASGAQPGPATSLLIIAGGFGPLLAALIVTAAVEGRAGVRRWLGRLRPGRAGAVWYAVALLLPILLGLVVYTLYRAFGGTVPADWQAPPVAAYPIALLFAFLLGGGQEEPGWRGFALPRLQQRRTALVSSIVVGLGWAAWHLPLFLSPAAPQSNMPFFLYLPHVLAISVIFTWLFNSTNGSVLIAMLFHAGLNTATSWFPVGAAGMGPGLLALYVVAEWALALGLIVLYGQATLSRRAAGAAEGALPRPQSRS